MRITELNSEERAWIEGNIADARAALTASGHRLIDGKAIEPSALDTAWSAWLLEWREGEGDPNPVINQFGHAFGDYLVERLHMEWKVVDDEYGKDAAVVSQQGDIVIVPANLVSKRFDTRTSSFFVEVTEGIADQVAKVRSASQPKDRGRLGRLFGRRTP